MIPGLPHFSPPFRIRVLLSTETEEKKKRGRPGNEAMTGVPFLPKMDGNRLGRERCTIGRGMVCE